MWYTEKPIMAINLLGTPESWHIQYCADYIKTNKQKLSCMIGACKCNRQKWKTQEGSDRWQCESENALLWHEPSEMSDNIIVSGLNVQTDMMFRLIGWMPLTRLMLKFHYLIILLRCPIVRIKARRTGSVRKPFPGLFCIHKCVRKN